MSRRSRGETDILAGLRRAARRIRSDGLPSWLDLERATFLQLVKAAAASGLAWALADALGSELPVLAALAALLAVRVTVYQTLRGGVQVVIGVVVGVYAAQAVGALVGVNGWTISILMLAALLLGRAMRLGQQSNEVAVSALLAVALGARYGTARLYDTALGAAVGLAVNALVAPPQLVDDAGRELRGIGEDLGILARDVAAGLTGNWTLEQARGWLRRARELNGDLTDAEDKVEKGDESVRYNPRRAADAELVARFAEARVALDHVVHILRSITRTLVDLVDRGVSESERAALSDLAPVLTALADAVKAFGRLQSRGPHSWIRDRRALEHALVAARIQRREYDDRRRRAPLPEEGAATRMLVAVLVDVDRLFRELDPRDGAHTAALPIADRLTGETPSETHPAG